MGAESRSGDSEAFQEAARAVRARRPGRDEAAVRTALLEELTSHGVTEPDPGRVESVTRMLVAGQGSLASFRVAREMWRTVAHIRVAMKGKEGPDWLKPPPGHEVGIPTMEDASGTYSTMEVAEVDLADDVQPFLAKAFDASFDSKWDDEGESQCKVWIDTGQAPPSGRPLPVILGQELIGTLESEDARVLERDFRKAEKRRRPLILEASIERDGGRFSVSVVVPPTS